MRTTATILLGLSLLCMGLGCRGWVSEQPPVHLNPNMDTQEKLKPYRTSTFFKNGRAMQTPPEGTVARTYAGNEVRDRALLATDEHYVTGKVAGAFATGLPSAVEVSLDSVKRGQERYNIHCAPCHGKDGAGQGTVARRLVTKPPTFHQQRIWDLVPGDIYNTITHGKNYPNMAPYAAQVSVEDRWNIVMYLRALMQTQKPDLPAFAAGGGFKAVDDPALARFDGEKSAAAKELDAQIAAALAGKVIEFDSGSATLTATGKSIVDDIVPLLTGNELLVRVDGHTDNSGDSAANHTLAKQRAEAVKAYFTKKGIAAARVFTYGFGEERPVADNNTDDGRAKNRRIEFRTVDAK